MADKYISYDAARRTIIGLEMRDCTGCRRYKRGIGDDYCFNEALLAASGAISELPAADVAPIVHAHWIWGKQILNRQVCSHCSARFDSLENDRYCPNCGAKMDECEGEDNV